MVNIKIGTLAILIGYVVLHIIYMADWAREIEVGIAKKVKKYITFLWFR